jgi:transcription antitermination factor NusG
MELDLTEYPGFVWTVAHVKPRCEKQVAEFAARHGVMHYLPLRRKVKRFQRRNVETRLPMFSGYLFVRTGAGDRERLAECHRIVRFFDMTPEREARLLEDLRCVRQLELTSQVTEVVVSPELAPGRAVVVRSGPFRGVRGVVVRRKDSVRITVNVEMLGQSVSAEVDVGELEPEE